jgi:hypothetical protein
MDLKRSRRHPRQKISTFLNLSSKVSPQKRARQEMEQEEPLVVPHTTSACTRHEQTILIMNENRDQPEELDMAERSSKRLKAASPAEDSAAAAAAALPALPPDTWANVMGYLPLADVMSLSSTSKSIHDDATPLVTTLHISKAFEMNPNLARKFRDVRDIFIYSLGSYQQVQPDDEWYDGDGIFMYIIDYETSARAVPFLSNSFTKLERVFFGSTLDDGQLKPYADMDYMDMGTDTAAKSADTMTTLIDSISAAYRCGALSPDLVIRGVCCLRSYEYDDSNGLCQCCRRAVKSWPIKSVAAFECGGSSSDQIASGRSYDLNVCIDRQELVRLLWVLTSIHGCNISVTNPFFSQERILAARPGGHELLHSKFRLFNLLGKGRREIIDKNGLVCIAYYTEDQLSEIKRAVNYANINAFDLDPREMTQCMVKSLYSEMLFPTPSSFRTCLLSVKARDELNADLGLTFDDEDAGQFQFMALSCLKFMVDAIENHTYDEEIAEECLSFLHRLVSIPNPPIREIVDSNAVPRMLELIEERCDESFSKLKSAQIVAKLIVEGSRNGHESDNNDVTSLCNFLFRYVYESQADSDELREADLKAATLLVRSIKSVDIACVAIMILYDVVNKIDANAMSALVDAGLATNIIQFLNRTRYNGSGVTDAINILNILAMASKKLLWDVMDAGVMNTITSSRDEMKLLRIEWELFLRDIVENYNNDTRLLQEIADHVGIEILGTNSGIEAGKTSKFH